MAAGRGVGAVCRANVRVRGLRRFWLAPTRSACWVAIGRACRPIGEARPTFSGGSQHARAVWPLDRAALQLADVARHARASAASQPLHTGASSDSAAGALCGPHPCTPRVGCSPGEPDQQRLLAEFSLAPRSARGRARARPSERAAPRDRGSGDCFYHAGLRGAVIALATGRAFAVRLVGCCSWGVIGRGSGRRAGPLQL